MGLRVKQLALIGFVWSVTSCGEKTVTGNSGDNTNNVKVQLLVDGTFIKEIVSLIQASATPSVNPTATPTPSSTPIATPNPSSTPTPSATPSPSSIPTPTPTPVLTPSPIPTPTSMCLPPPSGLVAWWTGNGNTLDKLGNHHGQAKNGLDFTTGLVNQAFELDGHNDYIFISDHKDLRLTGQLTIASWIKISDPQLNNYMRIISKKYHYTDDEGYELEYNPALNILTLVGSGSNLAHVINIDLDTNWHHVAGTITGSNAQLYVDGVEVTTDGKISPLKKGDDNLNIGRTNSGQAHFEGLIDEVQLYDKALTSSQIQAIFKAGEHGLCQ